MTLLIAGLVIFLGIHSLQIFASGLRNSLRSNLGPGPWMGAYSVISLIGFVMICYGFGIARQMPVVLWSPPHWMRHVTMLLMLPVFPLLLAAYLPGRIKAATKHPMLVAVKLWALAHLLANGMLHDALLFGLFLVWAVLDRISLKRRPQQSPAHSAPPSKANDVIAIVLGLALYGVFVTWAHLKLFGVSPMG